MRFRCYMKKGKQNKTWNGIITKLKSYGSHYEMRIESRSGIMVLFGRTSCVYFACMPDFNAGCHLSDPIDRFWNTERLINSIGEVDGITIAYALESIADKISC